MKINGWVVAGLALAVGVGAVLLVRKAPAPAPVAAAPVAAAKPAAKPNNTAAQVGQWVGVGLDIFGKLDSLDLW